MNLNIRQFYRDTEPCRALVCANSAKGNLVLYLLTDEQGTRPLKTRHELEQELQNLATESTLGLSQLDLILTVFVDSGLVLLLPKKNQKPLSPCS